MAGNTWTIRNPLTGKFDDWFELYNYGAEPVDLSGYYLTHSVTNQYEFMIPAGSRIPPGGFLLVWADKVNANDTPDLHANFKLSKSGTSIGLFAADGGLVDYVSFGPQVSDLSMGRYPDGSAKVYTMSAATPRSYNFWRNSGPVLATISDRVVIQGQTLCLDCLAWDPDAPPQVLTFSLGTGSPAGATLSADTGVLCWRPETAPSTNLVTVTVRDDGSPNLSATQAFTVTVVPQPSLAAVRMNGNQLEFSMPTLPGQFYQLEFKSDLASPQWTPIGNPISGTGGSLPITRQIDASTNGFFRLRILP